MLNDRVIIDALLFAEHAADLLRDSHHALTEAGAGDDSQTLVERIEQLIEERKKAMAEVEHWRGAAKEHAEAQAAAESEIERMQIKEKTLTAERDHFKAMLRERAARHLEAEEALEKQSLEFRAIAKAIDAAREAAVECQRLEELAGEREP